MDGSLFPWIFAQSMAPGADDGRIDSPWLGGLYIAAVIFAVFILPIFLGRFLGKVVKVPARGGSIGIILAVLIASVLIVVSGELRYGADIRGGTNLVYEIDKTAARGMDPTGEGGRQRVTAKDIAPRILNRLNPSGTNEILVRPRGEDQIEIIVPNVDQLEIEEIKRVIQNAGILQFRIVANQTDHQDIIQLARKKAASTNETERLSRDVLSADGSRVVGIWQGVGRDQVAREGVFALRAGGPRDLLRDARTGRLIEGFPGSDDPLGFEKWLFTRGVEDVDILLALERSGVAFAEVTGDDLASVRRSLGKTGMPEVEFTMKTSGAGRLQSLTMANQPDPTNKLFKRQMAIVLDGRVLSAPNLNQPISSQGVIQGNFTDQECEFLVNVLRSGSLPAALNKQPISENQVGAAMGQDAIAKGFYACLLALVATLVFMLIYYRFAGVIACLAMGINILAILAVMILIQQPITLPGLAGLVLTVGMSVDANVLVFERIREEIAKKSTARMAIRNGFDRALTTIVDSNLTTLITAIVLYWMGSDQVKGFAITLIIGLVISMFTAVFCSRVIFEIAERWRIVSFSMADAVALLRKLFLGNQDVDFMKFRYVSFVVSSILIVIGLAATLMRGREILDIDFNGGTSVTFVLKDAMPTEQVRRVIGDIFDKDERGLPIQTTLTGVTMSQFPENSVYKLDTSLPTVDALVERLVDGFTVERTGTRLTSYSLTASPAESVVEGEVVDAESGVQARSATRIKLATDNEADAAKINATTLLENLEAASSRAGNNLLAAQFQVRPVDATDWTLESQVGYPEWDIEMPVEPAAADAILAEAGRQLARVPVWQSISRIESRVASQMQWDAILALFLAVIFIVAYIWFRFQKVAYGFAAVVALVHDVLITLGFIAISHWLFTPLSFLLIEDFKISLTIVAAFLTIMGYSLNDTIVVFDRIREVKGKSPRLTVEMINRSLNQTLGRTLLTSSTTIIAILLLYVFGGEGLHGFAYALLIGILIGTYSSIFVASPVLLWLVQREQNVSRIRAS